MVSTCLTSCWNSSASSPANKNRSSRSPLVRAGFSAGFACDGGRLGRRQPRDVALGYLYHGDGRWVSISLLVLRSEIRGEECFARGSPQPLPGDKSKRWRVNDRRVWILVGVCRHSTPYLTHTFTVLALGAMLGDVGAMHTNQNREKPPVKSASRRHRLD